MKLISSKEEPNFYVLTLKSSEEDFKNIYLNHFLGVSKNLSVPGFRKGYAPLDMSINHIKRRGRYSYELERVVNKAIDFTVKKLFDFEKTWNDRIFGLALDKNVKELDVDNWIFSFEAKFEVVPKVTVADYSKIVTLVEQKDPEESLCPVPKTTESTEKDVISVSMFCKDEKGDVVNKYTYDVLEIDLENTRICKEIKESLIGLKPKDKKEIVLKDLNQDLKIEIIVLEVKEKKEINEGLIELLRLPKTTTIEQLKEALKKQYKVHNSYAKYQDIVKWILSKNNIIEPLPIENLKFEAHKAYQSLIKKGHENVSLDAVFYDFLKNLKVTFIVNEIVKLENIEISEDDKSEFFKDVTEQPWLYAYKPAEDFMNEEESKVAEYVKQFKALKILMKRWQFGN